MSERLGSLTSDVFYTKLPPTEQFHYSFSVNIVGQVSSLEVACYVFWVPQKERTIYERDVKSAPPKHKRAVNNQLTVITRTFISITFSIETKIREFTTINVISLDIIPNVFFINYVFDRNKV